MFFFVWATDDVEINLCMLSRYLAWSCRMRRSCCTSSAAALESVRQVAGTSATGAFCCCSSGAGRGTGCFCRLDKIRSLAAHREMTKHDIKQVNKSPLSCNRMKWLCLFFLVIIIIRHLLALQYQFWLYHCQGWCSQWSRGFGPARRLAHSAPSPTETEPLSDHTAVAPGPHTPATVPTTQIQMYESHDITGFD